MPIKARKELLQTKRILVFWTLSLVVYGILLSILREYEILSLFYHLALLSFPLILLLFKKESSKSLGLKKGDAKTGILYLFLLFIFSIIGINLQAFLSKKTIHLVFDISFPFLLSITLGPISEELFHRGLLQTKLEKLFGETKGILLSALLFSLIHIPKILFASEYVFISLPSLPFLTNPFVTLFSFFVLGMLFGYVYHDTKSVYYAIATHAIVNLVVGVMRY